MTTFIELGVPRSISDALAERGIVAAFPIQAMTIADAMAGRDLCGRAPTGSGKTFAFAIPLAALGRKGSRRRPGALVLVPTRELAAQVADATRPLGAVRGLRTATFYGGTSLNKDRQQLDRGVDIAVACPGRLADLVQRGWVDLSGVRLVVLDEADRMADMGFLPEVTRLLDRTHRERQTMLFSATLDGDVDVLIRRYQRDPARHELAGSERDEGDVEHLFWDTPPHERLGVAAGIVRNSSSAIVFTRTKHGADRLVKQLGRHGVSAAAIHGNRSQKQRERALADFGARRVTALVATDVAARGIHVDDVGVVLHYDPPATDKDYVHRSGRTGRAGADGLVVTLVVPDKAREVRAMQRALGMPQEIAPIRLEAVSGGRGEAPTARTVAGSQASERGNGPIRGSAAGRGRSRSGRSPGRGRRHATQPTT